jgi:hypothetical protein
MDKLRKLLVVSLLCGAFACGDDEVQGGDPDAGPPDNPDSSTACSVTPPAWSAPAFADNATVALGLRAQLDALTALMRSAEQQPPITVDEVSDLTALYEAGDPSLAMTASSSFDTIIDDVFADFVDLSVAGPQDLIDDQGKWTPGASGGIFGTGQRGLNVGGIEVRQLADKGLFGGGALYQYALGLTTGTIDESTIDSFAAAWGSNQTLDTEGRTDAADYAFRMGFHADMATALTDAKAYAADDECMAERDAAIVRFFRLWEQSLLARTVFYGNAAASEMAIAQNDSDLADALHELSEGLGLAVGFRGVADPASGPLAGAGRVITDAQIEAIMTALGVDITDLSASTTGLFVEAPGTLDAGVVTVEGEVSDAYELSPSDIASYRTPTEG